ncbi:MAG TPA: host attachment protein [Gammaproteobacteria bacterium]|jgi:protein required for attachment to host cells|nr:host attachment protein [Gammaproteobacteria bacterium]
MDTTWIVVADSARARIFDAGKFGRDLNEIEDLYHPESRLHEGDLRQGEEGSQDESVPLARSGTGPKTSEHEKHIEGFARDVARHLDDARHRGRFDKLVLVAAPAVLGELRDQIDAATAACVKREIDKNLAQHSPEEIKECLGLSAGD